jgi:hypothetical protein
MPSPPRSPNPHYARTTCCDCGYDHPSLRAVGSVRMVHGRVVCSAKAHSRGIDSGERGPALGGDVVESPGSFSLNKGRWRLRMRFAPQTALPPAPPDLGWERPPAGNGVSCRMRVKLTPQGGLRLGRGVQGLNRGSCRAGCSLRHFPASPRLLDLPPWPPPPAPQEPALSS